MKSLSLWQPWASLIALGLKKIETRSWYTPYRELLAIHASKRWTREEQNQLGEFRLRYPQQLATLPEQPPLGAVLCVVKLVDVFPTVKFDTKTYGWMEYHFGNFTPGRWAWVTEMVEVFDTPIPAKGEQGLWTWNRP